MKKTIAAGALGGFAAFLGIAFLIAASTSWGDFIAIPRGTSAGDTGRVRWRELAANGSHSVDWKATDSLAATNTYTWPGAYPAGNGYSLTSTTAGVTSWTNITGGGGGAGEELLETETASSSASLDFTTCLADPDFDLFRVRVFNLRLATDSVVLYLRMSTDGGSSYDSGTNYRFTTLGWAGTGVGQEGADGSTHIRLQSAGNADNGNARYFFDYDLMIFDPASTTEWKHVRGPGHFWGDTDNFIALFVSGIYKSTTAVNAFQIIASSGNIASGQARCYGVGI